MTAVLPEHVSEMARLGRLRAPREACGVFARGRVLELPNRAVENDLANFTVEDLLVAVQDLDDLDLDEMILWHTHPGGHVGPSRTDLELREQSLQYMVVALLPDGSHAGSRY